MSLFLRITDLDTSNIDVNNNLIEINEINEFLSKLLKNSASTNYF